MRSFRSIPAGLLLFAAVLAPSVPALGQPSAGAAGAQRSPGGGEKTADEYVREGRELAIKNDLQGAYQAYQAAWRLKRTYDIAGNLGVVELKLGKARDAAEHLTYCEQNFPSVRDAALTERLTRLQALLKEARAQVGFARVRVTPEDGSSAEGAEILVDGMVVGRAGAGGRLVHPVLQSDGMFVDAGSRTFAARRPGCKEGRAVMWVGKGSTVDVVLSPCRRELSMPLVIAGSSLAVVGLGLGIGSAIYSGVRSSDEDAIWVELATKDGQSACYPPANASRCEDLDDAYADRQIFRGLAIGGFVLGGAAVVATAIYVVTGRSKSPPSSQGDVKVQASFSPAPGGGSAVLWGTF